MNNAISKAMSYFYHHQSFGPDTTYEDIDSKAIAIRNSNLKKEKREVNEEMILISLMKKWKRSEIECKNWMLRMKY